MMLRERSELLREKVSYPQFPRRDFRSWPGASGVAFQQQRMPDRTDFRIQPTALPSIVSSAPLHDRGTVLS